MQTRPFETLHNILVVRLDNIGDLVMLTPALRALRQAYPAARITLMASPGGAQMAPLLPWIDNVLPWRAVWQDISKDIPIDIEKEHTLVKLLAEANYDSAFIFTSFSQSPYPVAYACYLAGIPIRAGQSNEFGGGLLTHWVKPLPNETHQAERNLHLLRETGIPVEDNAMELHVSTGDRRSAEAQLATLGIRPHEPYIVLAPGASAQARRYDEARFASIAQQISVQTGLPVVMIGSQREISRFPTLEALAGGTIIADAPAIAAAPARVYSLIGKTTLPEMAALIQRAELLIGNNSGGLHMAAAFNRPMLILFSGTELLEQWAPLSASYTATARFLFQTTNCTPCYGFTCRYQMECLDVPVENIVGAALELLMPSITPSNPLINAQLNSLER